MAKFFRRRKGRSLLRTFLLARCQEIQGNGDYCDKAIAILWPQFLRKYGEDSFEYVARALEELGLVDQAANWHRAKDRIE